MMVRDEWKNLNGLWDYAIIARDANRPEEYQGKILVPFAVESALSGVGKPVGSKQCLWYHTAFTIPSGWKGKKIFLNFGAIDWESTIWVNGKEIGTHRGGYDSFCFDITDALKGAGEQELVIRVWDPTDENNATQPHGKQVMRPGGIFYTAVTGIWQSVWLEKVGAGWIEYARWVPDLNGYRFELLARIAGRWEGLRLRVVLHIDSKVLARDEYAVVCAEVHRSVSLSDPGIDDYRNKLLWSPDRPTLVLADLELIDQHDNVLDRLHTYTAMRSPSVLGDRFMLNGRPLHLRLVLDQGYWPESGLTPPSDEAARADVELVKQMGFNGVRAHQRIPDPRYLYWADVLGLVVWEEMPSPYRFSTPTVLRLTSQWAEAIQRDISHPCVIVYVPLNESWGVPDLPTNSAHRHTVRAMYHLTKALDDSRPVVGNDGWEMDLTDIIAIHDYDSSPESIVNRYQDLRQPQQILSSQRPGRRVLLLNKQAYRGQPIMLTEFGGIAMRHKGSWGYSQVEGPRQLQRQYSRLMQAVHSLPGLAGFCYTQFADTYQEANGLLRADRTPKFPLEQMRKATLGQGP